MTDRRDEAGWTVTRNGEVVFTGSEHAAREAYSQEARRFPEAGIKLYSPPRSRVSAREAAKARLGRARDEVVQAIRERSHDQLMPAIEALVEAKVASAYLEDGGLIDSVRRLRAALEAVDACISPSDRAVLERLDGEACTQIPLTAAAYRALRAALRSNSDQAAGTREARR